MLRKLLVGWLSLANSSPFQGSMASCLARICQADVMVTLDGMCLSDRRSV